MENEKSLLEIFQIFTKRFRTLLIIILTFLIFGTSVGFFFNQKVYSSVTTLTIGAEAKRETDEYNKITGEPITETYIKYGSNKISEEEYKLYKEIFKSTDLLKDVINSSGVDWSINELRESISVEVPENSNTLIVKISRPAYEKIDMVIDELVNVFKIKNYEITGLENIQVIDLSSEVEEDNTVNVPLLAILSLFFGIIAAAIVVLIQDYLDDYIESEDEIKKLNLKLLGHVKKETYEEDLKKIRTKIEYSTQFLNKKTFVVASPTIGPENISINLVDVLSKSYEDVIFLDADLRNDAEDKNIGIETKEGLSDFLIGKSNMDDIIIANHQHYKVISTGTDLENPSEKLSSFKMKTLIKELEKQYSHIIIKGHPVNDVTDTVSLSTLTDGIILQVDTNRTTTKEVLKTKEILSDINVDILGVILVSN